MTGVSEEPGTADADDAEDREIYIPFLSVLIKRCACKNEAVKLEQMKKAYEILTKKDGSDKEQVADVRAAVKGWYAGYMRDKGERKSEARKEPRAACEGSGDASSTVATGRSVSQCESAPQCVDRRNDDNVVAIDHDEVCVTRAKPNAARDAYNGSMAGNVSDPRLPSSAEPAERPSTENSTEPGVAFNNNELEELLVWTRDRMQSGMKVENICNVALGVTGDGADRVPSEAQVDDAPPSEAGPAVAEVKAEAADTYYHDVTPFHLRFQGVTPQPSSVKVDPAVLQKDEFARRNKKKKKKKVKKEAGVSCVNFRGEIIDVEYESRMRERHRLAQEREREEAAETSSEIRGSERLAGADEKEDGNGRATGTELSTTFRTDDGDREERKRETTEELRKKREAQRRDEKVKQNNRRRQERYEEQQRRAMNGNIARGTPKHFAPFPYPSYPGPMVPYYPGPPMPYYEPMHMQQMPIGHGWPPSAPMFPLQPAEVNTESATSCIYCPFTGEPTLIMNHYVNDHLDKEAPVKLPPDQLKSVLRGESADDDQAKRENVPTGNLVLDDLSWIPQGTRFLEKQTCKLCTYSTEIRCNLLEHMQGHRKAVLVGLQGDAQLYRCRFCPATMANIEKFYEHCTSHTGEFMYACGHCGFRGYSREDVKKHINREHPGRNMQIKSNGTSFGGTTVYGYVCAVCGFVQMAQKKVERHFYSVHYKQPLRVTRISMAKVIPKPRLPPSVPVPLSKPAPPKTPASSNSRVPPVSGTIPKRRPPVKIRDDPRFRNNKNAKSSSPSSRRQAGPSGRRPRTPHIAVSVPVGPLLENGMFEGDHTNNEPRSSTAPPSGPLLVEENGTGEVPAYLTHCKLEQRAVDDASGGQDLSDDDNNNNEPDLGPADPPEGQFEAEIDLEEVQEELLTEEMKLETEMDIEEPVEETPHQIVNVKCESATAEEDGIDGACANSSSSSTAERPELPSIADTISKLAAKIQPKKGTVNKTTKNASTQLSKGAVIPSASASPTKRDNVPRLSPRRINDWTMRRKSLICGCGFLCVSMEALGKHRTHWHKSERRIHCPECSTRCEDVGAFAEHFQRTCTKITKKMFVCSLEPLCRFFTSSQTQFVSHMKELHPSLEWLPCHWCGTHYTTPDCLVTHIQRTCPARETLLSALQTAVAVTKTEEDLTNDVAVGAEGVGSPPDPAAPHLEVVYWCSFPECKHKSLEREVFFDHMHVVHPEITEYKCLHCTDTTFKNLNSLILHTEDKHRDGAANATTEEASTTGSVLPPPLQQSDPACSASDEPNPDDGAEQPTTSPVVDVELRVETTAKAVGDGVDSSAVSKTTLGCMEDICKVVALTYQVISSASLEGEVFQQVLRDWRASHVGKRGNIHPLAIEAKNPVLFAKQHKTPEALTAMTCLRKLMHLYKCGGKDCAFSTDDADEFRSHLSDDACRDGPTIVCLYCGEQHRTVHGITCHITGHHGESVFQCSECTFRCRSKCSQLVHAKMCHESNTAAVVTCGRPERESGQNVDDEGPDLLSLILPIVCTADGCEFVTMDTITIRGHIRECHPALVLHDCFHCGQKVDVGDVEEHLKRHNVFKFQCRYCRYGTSVGNEIVIHLCEIHPHRTGRVFIRATMTCREQAASDGGERDRASRPSSSSSSAAALPGGITIKEEPSDDTSTSCSEAIRSPDPATPRPSSGGSFGAKEANLFSCGYHQCRFSAPTILALDEHLQLCSKQYRTERLCCKQCLMPFRNMNSFLNHIRSHQAKLYYCGLCDYNKQLIFYVKNHMQAAHGLHFTETKCVPRYPSGSQSDTAEFVFEPVLPALRIRIDPDAGPAVVPPTQAAVAAVHVEQVGDIDSVPLQSIFAKDIKCAHCSFATKVRTNLIRHLEQHKRDENNPREAAASTQADAPSLIRSTAGSGLNTVDPCLRLFHPTVLPEYVSKKDRYKCCVKQCSFRASDSGTLEEHVSSKHLNLLVFCCPHCLVSTDLMPNLILHLSLHGPNLYKCPYCTYVNIGRQLVLGHGLADHPGVPNYVNIVREEQELDIRSNLLGRMNAAPTRIADGATNDEQRRQSGSAEEIVYTCPLCKKFRSEKMSIMRYHMFSEMNYKKFQCNNCGVKTIKKSSMMRHVKERHPGKAPDSFAVKTHAISENLVSAYLESAGGKSRGVVPSAPPKAASKADGVESPPRVHCPHCSYSSTKPTCVHDHILTHLQYRSYKCRWCESRFGRVHNLRSHHTSQHPGVPFKPLNEPDREIGRFVGWVLKLVQDEGVQASQANFNLKPWTLPCKFDGCALSFSSLKKFGDHFKEHLQKRAAEQKSDDGNVVTVEDDDDDVVVAPSTSTYKPPARKRRKLNSSGNEATPSFCSLCSFCSYCRPGVLKSHVLRHYDFRFYKCKHCTYEGMDNSDIKEHSKRTHPNLAWASEAQTMPEEVSVRMVGNREHFFIERGSLGADYNLLPDSKGTYWCCKCKYATSCLNSARYHCQHAHGIGTSIRCRNGSEPVLAECTLAPVPPAADADPNANCVECTMCDKVLPNMNEWLQHFNAEHNDSTESGVPNRKRKKRGASKGAAGGPKDVATAFQCKHCSYSCLQVAAMKRHQEAQHSDVEAAYEKVENAAVHQCPKCCFTSTDLPEARSHVVGHLHQFKCGLCPKTALTQRGILMHSAGVHSMHRVRVVKNPEYEKQKEELLSRLPTPTETPGEICVENICIQDVVEYQVLSSNPPASPSAEQSSSPLSRTVARKSTCKSPQKCASSIAEFRAKVKRKVDWPLLAPRQPDDAGFSCYGKRPLPVDTSKLTVFTNFRGMQNARTTVDHLGEIFNLNPVVLLERIAPGGESHCQ